MAVPWPRAMRVPSADLGGDDRFPREAHVLFGLTTTSSLLAPTASAKWLSEYCHGIGPGRPPEDHGPFQRLRVLRRAGGTGTEYNYNQEAFQAVVPRWREYNPFLRRF